MRKDVIDYKSLFTSDGGKLTVYDVDGFKKVEKKYKIKIQINL